MKRRNFLKLVGIAILSPSLPVKQRTFVVELLNENGVPFCGGLIKNFRCFSMMAERHVSELRLRVDDKIVHKQQVDVRAIQGDTITITLLESFKNKIELWQS